MAYHEIDGALFRDAPATDGKTHPIMHLALEVLGVKMNVAVWPAQTSAKGQKYWPCSGQYDRNESRRLVPVDVAQLPPPRAGSGGAASPAPASPSGARTAAQVDGDAGDLPF